MICIIYLYIYLTIYNHVHNILMIKQIFLSPQVKRSVINSNKFVYKYGNISKISNFIELLLSAQSSSRNENFVSTSKNFLKNRNWTFPVVRYFTWKTESRVCLRYFLNDCSFVCIYACIYVCMDGWMDGWMYRDWTRLNGDNTSKNKLVSNLVWAVTPFLRNIQNLWSASILRIFLVMLWLIPVILDYMWKWIMVMNRKSA